MSDPHPNATDQQDQDGQRSLPDPAQGPAQDVPTFVDLVEDERACMMTTIGLDGVLHARPMAVQQVDDDGTVWFLAFADSPKIDQLAADPRVNLSFAPGDAWVSASGSGHVVNDPERRRSLWNRYAQAWFQRDEDDPDVTVIRFDPSGGEYWKSPSSPVMALGVARSMVTGAPPPEGDNAKLDLD